MEIPMEYRIMFIAAVIGGILLAERHFAFDIRQRLKMFMGYFILVFGGLIIAYQILQIVVDFFKKNS